jgi:hypothetical protein
MASPATDRSPAMEQQREGWRPRRALLPWGAVESFSRSDILFRRRVFFFAFFMILGEKLFTKLFIHFFKTFYFCFI